MNNNNNKARLLQGNEACVQGALYAGAEFFAGYPITPSTEVAEGSLECRVQIHDRNLGAGFLPDAGKYRLRLHY